MLDLAGQRFGRLLVIEPTSERRGASVVWRCLCDCGAVAMITTANLRRGFTKSCGCYNREQAAKRRRVDLAGQRFGRLVAIEPTEERRWGAVVWRCQCDCGAVTKVVPGSLLRGLSTSCGCYMREQAAKRARIDLAGQRFGRLVAIEPISERRLGQRVAWRCICDCGEETEVRTAHLRSGRTQSCGCYSRDLTLERNLRDSASDTGYPDEFKAMRIIVLDRDGRRCIICGAVENGRSHDVHHIDYNKHNNSEFNLATLCMLCHRKTNWNRDVWQVGLNRAIETIYKGGVPVVTSDYRERIAS